ncbi:MAG: MBOAT family protein [Bacteroidetes bacterium]|nr:MBOAT family protein [Bacteroidota bacterium]
MVFSSSLFLLYFFPFFLILYFIIPYKLKNLLIVFASILFYSWGGPKYIFIIFFSIIIDFVIARLIYKSKDRKRKLWLTLAICINLSFLFYFKYANFFLDNINSGLSFFGYNTLVFMRVALPIGISFFTFHEMSYIIDVYRDEKPPMKSIVDYSLYILFFPQLIAGPIIRFNEITDQITDRRNNETIDNRLAGFYRFIIGLSKKVLIANVLGAEVDHIFALNINDISSVTAWIGIIAYAFQIYFDFSGYSDMAIGIARMLGFVFPENFNNPYTSQSITEFWRRWHITLSRWMRDYLYIPLGGNKVSTKRLYFNLWLVFLLSGLWHGASWNFIAWGAYQGLFLIADRLFLLNFLNKLGKIPAIVITFVIVLVGWAFFRIQDISTAFLFITKMFSFDFSEHQYYFNEKFRFIMILAFFFSFVNATKFGKWLEKIFFAVRYTLAGHYSMTLLSIVLFVLSVAYISTSGFNPFIYFRF